MGYPPHLYAILGSPDQLTRSRLFESGNFADVDIICQGDVVLKAHKVILCTRSSWFKAALTGLWLEADSLRICVDDKDPATMKILLKYLYSGSKDDAIPIFLRGPSLSLCILLLP